MNKHLLLLLLLIIPNILVAQEKPCSTPYSAYDEKVNVTGMVSDSLNCGCHLCKIYPKNNSFYKIKGARYCDNRLIGYGKVDNEKDKDNGKCVVFKADQLVSYRNDFFLTGGISNLTYLNNDKYQNRFLIAVQAGYYFRNRTMKPKRAKAPQIHPSYSLNIRHGLILNETQGNSKCSPFLGVDLSVNAYIRSLKGFLFYSGGYSLVLPNNSSRLYYSLGFNLLIL